MATQEQINLIGNGKRKAIVVEHLDPELEEWSALEYETIADECGKAGANFFLSSIPHNFQLPTRLNSHEAVQVEERNAEDIFAAHKERICLLDPAANEELSPQDGDIFSIFLFGGILGDDPPRDRTSILRKRGFKGRSLGSVQMTTDTAVRVTLMVIVEKMKLGDIPFIDHPDIKISQNESTQMPFRYVKDPRDRPVMPNGMIEVIRSDADKQIVDLAEVQ